MILPTAKTNHKNPKIMLVNLDGNQGAITVGIGQANGRSFVRYIDFKCSSGLAQDIVASLTGNTPLLKMYLYSYGSSPTGIPTQVYLPYGFQSGTSFQPTVTGSYGLVGLSATGTTPTYLIRIDYKDTGIGGANATTANDGVYLFKIDHLKDGSYSFQSKTFRLYGDCTGDGIVSNVTDRNAVLSAAVYGKLGLYAENCDGSGQVYTGDVNATQNNSGRTVVTLYNGVQI